MPIGKDVCDGQHGCNRANVSPSLSYLLALKGEGLPSHRHVALPCCAIPAMPAHSRFQPPPHRALQEQLKSCTKVSLKARSKPQGTLVGGDQARQTRLRCVHKGACNAAGPLASTGCSTEDGETLCVSASSIAGSVVLKLLSS